ncbi:MAG: hypothetical protein NTV86_15145 [Planctomycetota bacterium]|nr:hypothetical protein [Planctomycetota bacterium]
MTLDRNACRVAATAATAAGAALSLVVAAALLHATLSRAADQPSKDPAAVAMVEALRAADAKGSPDAGDNGALALRARELEVRIRADYFRRQAIFRRGAWVLPLGLAACSRWGPRGWRRCGGSGRCRRRPRATGGSSSGRSPPGRGGRSGGWAPWPGWPSRRWPCCCRPRGRRRP